MVQFTKIELKGLLTDSVETDFSSYRKLSTKVLTEDGKVVGKFSTHGVGVTEHNRRVLAVFKQKISKSKKND